ncbi:hypothetical protein D3C76_1079490 [compost metagenome]
MRATLNISGSMITKPTSKNMGMPITKATIIMAQGIIRSDVRLRMTSAICSVTPASARILPSIAPSAITTPTAPSVFPAPVIKWETMFSGSILVAKPTPTETTSKARSGCILIRDTMSATSTRTLTNAVSKRSISKGVMKGSRLGWRPNCTQI